MAENTHSPRIAHGFDIDHFYGAQDAAPLPGATWHYAPLASSDTDAPCPTCGADTIHDHTHCANCDGAILPGMTDCAWCGAPATDAHNDARDHGRDIEAERMEANASAQEGATMPEPVRKARDYCGPFTPPPFAEYPELASGAIGWRFTKRHIDDGSRWEPTGWEIVYPDGILTLDLDGVGVRDSILYAIERA